MTPEELAKEREASRRRQAKRLEREKQERPASNEATRPMSRQERLKLREDEFVLPHDV